MSAAPSPPRPLVGIVGGGANLLSGAPRCLLQLACGLDRERYAALPYCTGPGELADALVACGYTPRMIRRDPLAGGVPAPYTRSRVRRAGARVRYAAALARSFGADRLDLVHVNTLALSSAAAAASTRRIPVVWHIHEEESFFRGPRALRLLPLRHLSRRIIAVSHFVERLLVQRGIPAERIEVVHNGIDATAFRAGHDPGRIAGVRDALGLKPGLPVVGMMGKLTWFKGADLFLDMAAQLGPRAQYLVVGDSDHPRDREYKASLERRVAEQSGSMTVVFAGHRADTADLLSLMDVFVAPARGDPLPLVVLEAMTMERPVVATSTGGQPEMVGDGESGVLVPPEDAARLAAAVAALLQSPGDRLRFGAEARRRVELEFTLARYVARVTAVWDAVLAQG